MAERRALAAIMFTDIKGYTQLMNRDERAALEFLRVHNAVLDESAKHFSGEVIKSIGDAYLICFASVLDAAQCAWEAQQRFKVFNQALTGAEKLLVRISIHLGDVIVRDGDIYGDGVNLASRLQSVTRPGGISLSRELFAQVKGRLPFAMRSMGLVELKGLAEPVEVFEMPTGLEEGGSPDSRADALLGRSVGPCLLEKIIGRGGMGTVYRGRHKTLDRPMAVKVLSADALSEAAAERLLAEARAAAAVEHPSVVRIYDAGRQGSLRYVVMQLIEGETLEALVARAGPLPPEQARKVMREVLQGLSAAHGKGVIHRDIKPANIMLEAAGGVKILDFGLAAPAGAQPSAAAGDAPAGSFDFMPPEQGFDAPPDPRQDLYALGATWFYALAGLPPFSGADAAAMLLMHREAPVPDVRAANREVTSQTSDLLKRLMEKDPRRRPASAEEVLAELELPGMVIEVSGERSPFSLLPPPPEPEPVGVAADPVIQAALRAAPDPAGPEAPGALPPPPPELPPEQRMALPAKLLLVGGFLLLFGRHWRNVGAPDLLGAAGAAGASLCALALLDGPAWGRRALSTALFGALLWCVWRLGGSAVGLSGVEVLAAGGLGLTLGAAGLVLAFWTASSERPLGCALLLVSVLALILVSAGLSPDRLAATWAALRASGGLYRWAGVAAALAWVAVARLTTAG